MESELVEDGQTVHAPQVLDAEVLSALRRMVMRGMVTSGRAQECVDDLKAFRVNRYPTFPFLQRVWNLRHNLTPFDASYIVLAEALNAPLVTVDPKLAKTKGHRAQIKLLSF